LITPEADDDDDDNFFGRVSRSTTSLSVIGRADEIGSIKTKRAYYKCVPPVRRRVTRKSVNKPQPAVIRERFFFPTISAVFTNPPPRPSANLANPFYPTNRKKGQKQKIPRSGDYFRRRYYDYPSVRGVSNNDGNGRRNRRYILYTRQHNVDREIP